MLRNLFGNLRFGPPRLHDGHKLPKLRDALRFDEEAYLGNNPDVRDSVRAGQIQSGLRHYFSHGIWEGRTFPCAGPGWRQQAALGIEWLVDGRHGVARRVGLLPWHGALNDNVGVAAHLRPLQDVEPVPDGIVAPSWRGKLMRAVSDTAELAADLKLDPGCYLLTLEVASGLGRAHSRLVFEDARGLETGAAVITHRPGKAVRRLVWVTAGGAAVLRLAPLGQPGLFHVRTLRLRRVDERFAESRMLRRIEHHDPKFAGWSPQTIYRALQQQEQERSRGVDDPALQPRVADRLRQHYEATFRAPSRRASYEAWIREVEEPHLEALESASRGLVAAETWPRISVLLPVYEPKDAELRACLESVLTQSYPHWEVCAVDDASPSPHVRRTLEEYASRDARIRVHFRERNGHIAAASNDALERAAGSHVALLDHDDVLARHALFQVAHTLKRHPDAELVYSDEDKLDLSGERREPHFKPDFDPDRLLEQCYLGHLVVARTERVRAVGGFRKGYEGSQDHDLWLRVTEHLKVEQIVHVPWVLYHWRQTEGSTAADPNAKSYAAEAGLRAVRSALERRELPASADHHPTIPNAYRVRWKLPRPAPLVSIIVPTRDGAHLLQTCVEPLLQRTTYPNFELLLVDNGSAEPRTFECFERLAADPRVRILKYPGAFNFAAINNFAVEHARGQVLALVNNDIEPIEPRWLEQMVAHALREEIGCVGAKLLYPDDTIQHAGVILGIGGVAGHSHKHMPAKQPGYFSRPHLTHSVSAVTAACLVVEKAIYVEVGGMDTDRLAVAFNDIDLCLKVRATGRRNLFVPDALLYHHESASRGSDDAPEHVDRFRREVAAMKARWSATLERDPYYSRHLTLVREDFGICELP